MRVCAISDCENRIPRCECDAFATIRPTRASPLHPVLLDLPVQRPLADAEDLGGLFAVAVSELERVADQLALGLFEADAGQAAQAGRGIAGGGAEVRGDVFRAEAHR